MPAKTERYVVEIDVPEGYLSIDCDIEYSDVTVIKIFLNQSSVSKENFTGNKRSRFVEKLMDYEDIEIKTARKDIREYLTELLRNEFGDNPDILIRDIDLD